MIKKYINAIYSTTGAVLFILVLFAFFIFTPCNKSCNKGNDAIPGTVVTKHQQDSIAAVIKNKEFADTIEFLNGQIELKNNQLIANRYELDSFMAVVRQLLKKHKPVTPAIDTSITTVPNGYIEECEDCFSTLTSYNQRAEGVIADYNELNELYIQQAATYDNQVWELNSQRDSCYKRFNELKGISTGNEPTRKIKLGISTMSINSILPNAIGPGIMYEDKRGNNYVGKVYVSEYGKIYAIDVYKTLRFKKRRRG